MSDLNVFAEPTPQASTLDMLVGEGRKYATPEDLAKSRIEADKYIQQLEAENAQFREGIQARIEQLRQPPADVTPPSVSEPEQRAPEVDLDARIREAIEQTNRKERLSRNVNEVSAKLVEVYGTPEKANEVVKARAQELGVSLDFLMQSAAASPKAFYAQIGLDTTSRPAPAVGTGAVNPSALSAANPQGGVKPGTYKYYEQLRQTNPKLYNKPATQLQMHKDAMEQGEAFFA